jgi:anti-sigma factor (TIGR02949 family)
MTDDDCVDTGASNCDEAMERLYEYLDEEMDEATAEGIRSHLSGCGGCHDGFDFEKRLKVVVRERLAEEVPQSFINRLRRALDDEAARRY